MQGWRAGGGKVAVEFLTDPKAQLLMTLAGTSSLIRLLRLPVGSSGKGGL